LNFDKKDSARSLFKEIDTTSLSLKEKLSWWILSYNVGEPTIGLNELASNFHLTKAVLDDETYLKVSNFLFEKYTTAGIVKRALEFKTLYSDRKDSIVESEKVALGHAVKLKRIVSAKNEEIVDSRIANDKLKYSIQIEEERNKKWRYTTILSIMLSLILLYSLYILYKRKSDKLKFNKKELKHEKMRKEILINKLESAKQSMNDKNLEIDVLLANVSRNNLDSAAVDTMMTNLKDRNWAIFLSDFELIYPHFFEAVTKYTTAPLSKNERRLCALIKLNLSNKEMSDYVFVSQESIKKAKNRLFKKFQKQGSGQEISDLLRNL
jgi:DNA-binding CsgD family transcriptional regulator